MTIQCLVLKMSYKSKANNVSVLSYCPCCFPAAQIQDRVGRGGKIDVVNSGSVGGKKHNFPYYNCSGKILPL